MKRRPKSSDARLVIEYGVAELHAEHPVPPVAGEQFRFTPLIHVRTALCNNQRNGLRPTPCAVAHIYYAPFDCCCISLWRSSCCQFKFERP